MYCIKKKKIFSTGQQIAQKKKKVIFKSSIMHNSFGHYFSLQNKPNKG